MINRWVFVMVLLVAPPALADGHAGLDLRADSGAHPIRIGGGVERDELDVSLVVDPMVFTDGQYDGDLLATWRVSDGGWAVLGGWRTSAIGIAGGRQ
jgi:hypothetical protein